jgi:hypothetical protein
MRSIRDLVPTSRRPCTTGVYIETAYSMIKGNFGSALRSKSDTGQINEALCKVLCNNICVLIQAMHEPGVEPTFYSGLQ